MLSQIQSNRISDNVRTIVLPCSHEVDYKAGRNCDEGLFANTENIPRVDKIKDFPKEMEIKSIESTEQIKKIKIDTDTYSRYYNPSNTKIINTEDANITKNEKEKNKEVLRHKSPIKKCNTLTMFQLLGDGISKKLQEANDPLEQIRKYNEKLVKEIEKK